MHSTAKVTKKATEGSEETDSRVSVVSEAGEPMLFMEPDQIAFPLSAKSGNHHWRKGVVQTGFESAVSWKLLNEDIALRMRVEGKHVQMVQPPRNQGEPATVEEEWPSYFTISDFSNLEPTKVKRRKTLRELQHDSPPGFINFESAADWTGHANGK